MTDQVKQYYIHFASSLRKVIGEVFESVSVWKIWGMLGVANHRSKLLLLPIDSSY